MNCDVVLIKPVHETHSPGGATTDPVLGYSLGIMLPSNAALFTVHAEIILSIQSHKYAKKCYAACPFAKIEADILFSRNLALRKRCIVAVKRQNALCQRVHNVLIFFCCYHLRVA